MLFTQPGKFEAFNHHDLFLFSRESYEEEAI